MIKVTVMDIREGYTEKKLFKDEIEMNNYLKRNPFVIVRNKSYTKEVTQ